MLRLVRTRSGGVSLLVGRGSAYVAVDLDYQGIGLLYSNRATGACWAWGIP